MRGSLSPAFALAGAFVLLAAAAACGEGNEQPAARGPFSGGETVPAIAPTPVPTPTMPNPSSDPVAAARSALEATVSAASHEDIPELLSLVQYAGIECDDLGPGRPVCPPSAAEGTRLMVFPYVACASSYADADELEGVLIQLFRGRGPELFALVRTTDAVSGGYFPLGPYVAVLRTNPPFGVTGSTGVILVLDAEGRIRSLRTGCRASPEQLYATVPVIEAIISPKR